MTAILTIPIAVAAIVLGVAGTAKLRSPAGAARALAALGVPAGGVRPIACGELALAALVLIAPGRATAGLLAVVYAALALVAGRLARRGEACGCFGEESAPATAAHVWLSAAIALVAAAGVVWPPHGLGWVLSASALVAGPLALGIAGAAYATVIAYTELPAAWGAWRPR